MHVSIQTFCILEVVTQAHTSSRIRNPRGEGARLREEIVAAASELLEQSGNEAAITLRAVARRVGISAPSIYPHFANPEEILNAVLARAFEAMVERLRIAVREDEDPVRRLRAAARAYVAFAAEQPHRYRVLFERHRPRDATGKQSETVGQMVGADAFAILLDAVRDCIGAGASKAPSPLASATALWVALHGYVTLRATTPKFPWPDTDEVLDTLVTRLAWLEATPPGG
jgi:AcrR family transcriptional regulator